MGVIDRLVVIILDNLLTLLTIRYCHCYFFANRDKQTVVQIIKKLGGGKLCEEVGEETSHVVCGDERRTLSFLMGIARGCWILSDVWLYQSLEMNAWAPEEPFEMFQYAPASKVEKL